MGSVVEPFESILVVYRHRLYWRPARVKVVLLAESHVFTPLEELSNTVDLSDFGFRDAPRDYVRFVYCLGYGEDATVNGRVGKNTGTWQFWKLFYACVNGVEDGEIFSLVLKNGTPNAIERIRNKLRVLTEMKRRGIWLVDSSLLALYVPSGKKADPKSMDYAITESWTSFWHEELRRLQPNHAICVGVGVHSKLKDRLSGVFSGGVSFIEQPNARLSSAGHEANLRACGEICGRFAPSREE